MRLDGETKLKLKRLQVKQVAFKNGGAFLLTVERTAYPVGVCNILLNCFSF
jgi:hypothetical protein